MFNLYFLVGTSIKTAGKRWRIADMRNNVHFDGSLKDVMNYANFFFQIPTKELYISLDEMVKSKKDAAHFGIMRSFIYTFNSEEEPPKKESMVHGLH
jgi:hypothetical protein